MNEIIEFPARFMGPPGSANGGWACGVVAELSEGPVAVELRAPPPLDRPLEVVRSDDGVEIRDGDTLVARAVAAEPPPLEAPMAVDLDVATAAAANYGGFEVHPFPECFVCGPDRDVGDGLRIFPGPVDGADLLAAPWTPDETNSNDGDTVSIPNLWAALDCPSGWATFIEGRVSVLARLTAAIADAPIPVGEPLVVLGWRDRVDGRKQWGHAALLTADGTVVARSDALWIALASQPAD